MKGDGGKDSQGMEEGLGTFLWEMRTEKGLSLGQLAKIAGLDKSALSRWETGKRQPRMAELEATLIALGASASQRARAFAQVEAPRAIRYLRQTTPIEGLGAPPTTGDLLRALRLRKGWTQEQVSARLGIARQTLTRWEQGERFPSTEQTQALCYVLDAEEEEIVALTTGACVEAPSINPHDWAEARERLQQCAQVVYHHIRELQDLRFLMLEREAWHWAISEAEARTELAHIYAYHASFSSNYARWQEAFPLAQKAMTLLSNQPPDAEYVRAIIALAGSAVYGGHQIVPQRGVQLLKPLMYWKGSPEYQAWMLADIARYASMSGKVEAAIALSEQAQQVAEQCENPSEPYLRHIDHAWILMQAGRYEEALNRLPDPVGRSPGEQVAEMLVQVEAHILMGKLSEGQDWLQQAQDLIETHALTHLHPKFEILKAKF